MRFLVLAGALLTVSVGAFQEGKPSENMLNGYVPSSELLQQRFNSIKTHVIELADRMPEADYGFKPTPEMEPFSMRIGHIADHNFEDCSYLVDKPDPHKGEQLDKLTAKPALMKALRESFEFCEPYMSRLLKKEVLSETVDSPAPPGFKIRAIAVEKGGVAMNMISHNSEMYGYLAVYLRLKGITPPTSGRAR